MSVTIYDIAKDLNLSASTVSRALNVRPDSHTSEATRQRVIQAAKRLGYRPNALARALITGKTYNIGLYAITTLERTGQHFARMLGAMDTRARALGYRILVCGDIEGILGEGRVDGMLLLSKPLEDIYAPVLQSIPRVYAWSTGECISNCVSWSDIAGVCQGTEYLADMGHRTIVGLFGDFPDIDPPMPKVTGFRQAVQKMQVQSIECFGELSTDQFENGYLLIQRLLQERDDFTAVVARNDYLALGAMKALKQAGKAVPQDVSIVGYNDTILAHCADPALTSVRAPFAEAGELAVERLIKLIEGEASEFPGIMMPTSVTIRESTAPPRSGPTHG